MIVSDHSDQPPRRRRGGTGAMFIALVAVIVGGVTLASLTSPVQETSEATTSTSTTTTLAEVVQPIDLDDFSVDQIARGEPFEWETTLSVVEGYPMTLLRHDGSIYLFSTDVPNFSAFESGGLRGWRSGDGLTWEPLGQIIDRSHKITSVSSTAQGLVALELPEGRAFRVWHSDDGVNWETQLVQIEGLNEMTTVYPQTAGGTDQFLVVAGNVYLDTLEPLEEKLGEIAHYGWGTDVIGNEVRFTLYGPLGPLVELSADEVGLSEEEQQMIIEANATPDQANPAAWVNTGGQGWQPTVIPDAQWIDRFVATSEGHVIGHGWGATTAGSWISGDGLTWEKMPPPVHHYLEAKWGDRLVAPSQTGGLSISVSPDGGAWELIGPDEHFPDPISWWVGAIGAGPGGIALSVGGWNDRMQFAGPSITSTPATITGSDGTLIIDFESNEYRLETEAGDRTWSGMSMTRAGIGVDLDEGTIQFSDPESGALLASFPLEDLIEAQEQVTFTGQDDSRYDAFAFTSDGEEWTIQAIEEMGSAEMLHLVLVTDTHVVVTAMGAGGFYTPNSSPGFDIWAAEIP